MANQAPDGVAATQCLEDSDNVVVFKRDRSTGGLEQRQSIAMKTARCIVWGNAQRRLRKPKWHQVADLVPEQKGVNLHVKVAAGRNPAKNILKPWKAMRFDAFREVKVVKEPEHEVVLGDSSGVVALRPREQQLELCKEGPERQNDLSPGRFRDRKSL